VLVSLVLAFCVSTASFFAATLLVDQAIVHAIFGVTKSTSLPILFVYEMQTAFLPLLHWAAPNETSLGEYFMHVVSVQLVTIIASSADHHTNVYQNAKYVMEYLIVWITVTKPTAVS
jgi:hypothetical protein